MQHLLESLKQGTELSIRQVEFASKFLLDEKADDDLKAEFLSSLATKGETPAEIAMFVENFLQHAVDPQLDTSNLNAPTLDVCGTGGDKLNLFNVSTTAMFVVAAAGAIVIKHGNRGITSKSGGADVLEALGIKIDLPPAGFRECISKAGVGFLFAPNYHPAFKAVVNVRKQLAKEGKRSIFNLIGPLLNPARPSSQLVGVSDPSFAPVFAEILQRLGRKSAWVVCGKTKEGQAVDELSLMGSTNLCKSGSHQKNSDIEISPEDFGLARCEIADLQGGDAKENAEILKNILSGKATDAQRDMVLLNAAGAIACAGLADDIADGITIARNVLKSGEAMDRLVSLQDASSQFS